MHGNTKLKYTFSFKRFVGHVQSFSRSNMGHNTTKDLRDIEQDKTADKNQFKFCHLHNRPLFQLAKKQGVRCKM
jgi:hypothetical protein